jgi:hypothetical protein
VKRNFTFQLRKKAKKKRKFSKPLTRLRWNSIDVLGIESGGKLIVFLNSQDADEIGATASGMVRLNATKDFIAIINMALGADFDEHIYKKNK